MAITYRLERDSLHPHMMFIYREKDDDSLNEPPGTSIIAIIYKDWVLAERITAELNGEEVVKR